MHYSLLSLQPVFLIQRVEYLLKSYFTIIEKMNEN